MPATSIARLTLSAHHTSHALAQGGSKSSSSTAGSAGDRAAAAAMDHYANGSVSAAPPVRGRSMSIMGTDPYTNMQYSGMSYPYSVAQPQMQYVHAGGMVMPSAQLHQGQMPLVLYAQPKKRSSQRRHGHKKPSRSVSVEPMYIRY